MDKRLKLTEHQWEVLERYCKAVKEIEEANIKFVTFAEERACYSEQFAPVFVFNGEHISHFLYKEGTDRKNGDILVQINGIPTVPYPCGYLIYGREDQNVGVRFKDYYE